MKDQELMLTVMFGVIIMLVVIVITIWFFNQGQKKIIAIKLQKKENELAFQKTLLINTVKTQETERDRISSELHDDIASKLNIIHLNIHLLKKKIKDDPEVEKLIDQIESSLKQSTERTRNLSHELMPQLLKKFGIHHALKEMANIINISQVVQLSIKSEHLIQLNDDFKLLHLYRIIQELLNNTLKYAKANIVEIVFEPDNEFLVMTYRDNGIGFDPENLTSGLGIGNIKTRSELLKGVYSITSDKTKKGMLFYLKFPNNDQD